MLRRAWGLTAVAAVLAVSPGSSSARAASTDWCTTDCVRAITIHYRSHAGVKRAAVVLLPQWYGPGRDPALPLIISPHGRGVPPRENVARWDNLPAEGPFIVVNPSGDGRKLHLLSWGFSAQIDDLARMPAIVARALPWVHIDRSRIYAMGTSMGGQEALLLAARHPKLLAGAAAFDAVTDMSRRYREIGRLRCNTGCERGWRQSLGAGLQYLLRFEVGGTPRQVPRAYARRSPMAYARRLAFADVPLQLWWSSRDQVVGQETQTPSFARRLQQLNPDVPLYVVRGKWRHANDMAASALLYQALKRFGLVANRRFARLHPERLVHPRLPWHEARLDGEGKLLAWYRPDDHLGYDRVLRLGWRFIERRADGVYLRHSVYDDRTLRGTYWQHSPAFLNSAFVDSALAWYAYSADRRAVAAVRGMLDYQLAHGTTPGGWAWPRVPFPTSCGGDSNYGRCLADTPPRAYGGVEPDKVGLLGRGYLRFYELTGERRFLRAAVAAADALARHVRPGDARHMPWPFRVDGRTGRVIAGAEFGGAVVGPVALLDELIRIGAGDAVGYRRARDLAWSWLLRYQLTPGTSAFNRWSGFYEDVRYNPASRNQAVPTLTALYLLGQDDPASVDPQWRLHVTTMLAWVRASMSRGPFRGAVAIDEQRAPGRPGCCSPAGLGSTTSRWAAANALLYSRTGEDRLRETAFRSLNYATYFAAGDGRIACCGQRRANTYWFSDGYADYLRSFNWAMGAIPELAPARQTHLLGSSSVVRRVVYGRRSVSYATFDRTGTEVVRTSFRVRRVRLDGRAVPVRGDLTTQGYTVQRLGGGDFVVRVRRDGAARVQLAG